MLTQFHLLEWETEEKLRGGVSLQRVWAHFDLAFGATRTRSAAGPGR